MKKLIAAMLVVSAPLASAKLGLNVDVSAGGNFTAIGSGSYIVDAERFDLADDLRLEGQTGFYLSGSLEHPIPILPNVRLHHKSQTLAGQATLSEQLEFLGQTFDLTGEADTTLSLTHTDATLFWGIPFLPVVDIEFGLNGRLYNLGVSADVTAGGQTESFNEGSLLPVPMLYVAGDATIPVVGLNLGGEYKTLPLGDTQISELNVYGRYYAPLPTNILVKVGVEAGWRQQSIVIADETLGVDTSDYASSISTGGAYVGLTARF